MKKVIIISLTAISLSCFSIHHAQAQEKRDTTVAKEAKQDDKTKRDLIGFGAGAASGAIVGGPVGGIIGGLFGIFVANDINKTASLKSKNTSLAQAQLSLSEKQEHILALQRQYAELEQAQMIQLASFDTKASTEWMHDLPALESNVTFKTASFNVEDTFNGQLNSVAGLLKQYPMLKVKLTGFADKRGDSQYNQLLSQQRADAVQSYLIEKKVKPSQIVTLAQGEASTALGEQTVTVGNDNSTSPEALFFDRRVTLKLFNADTSLSAAN